MLGPVLIGLAGVALGGAALYFSLAGSGEAGAARDQLDTISAKAEGFETRIRDLESKYSEQAAKLAALEKQIAQMTTDTNGAFRQVGVEINRNRNQISQTSDKLADLIEQVNRAGRSVATVDPERDAAASPPAGDGPDRDSARARLPVATLNESNDESGEVVIVGEERTHTIRAGDTFTKLSQQYGVSVAAILSANPDVDPRRLAVGQKITIP